MPESPPPLSSRSTRQARRAIFFMSVLAGLVMSLLPFSPDQPTTGWDKTNHLLGFAVLTVLGCWSYPGRIPAVLAGLFAHGALIELLQSFTSYRLAEWGDLLADALGLVLGWTLVWAWQAAKARLGRR